MPVWRSQWRQCSSYVVALIAAILILAPQLLHRIDARSHGLPIPLNSDEYLYLTRVQEALQGHWNSLGAPFTGASLPMLQPGFLEFLYGSIFRFFGVNVASAFLILDGFESFLLVLLLLALWSQWGLSRLHAAVASALFVAIELYDINRPVHQRGSFLLMVLALLLITRGVQGQRLSIIAGGALMGMLVGVYFWAWTAVWAWMVVVFLFVAAQRAAVFRRLLLGFGVGIFVAAPFVWQTYAASTHPLYSEVFSRSGVAFTRFPESWIWSFLFSVMALATAWQWFRYRRGEMPFLPAAVVTAGLLLNQQLLHGIRFLFASHYIFFLTFSAICAIFWSMHRRHRPSSLFIVVCAGLYLAGAAYDNRYVFAQWSREPEDFAEQHLADAVGTFAKLPRTTVLSDPQTSSFLAAYTAHDVVYSPYIQHELRSHRDIAERYCLTQIPLDPALRRPDMESVLVYGAAYDGMTTTRERELARKDEIDLVVGACAVVDANPALFLASYGVTGIFWNEEREPEWDLKRLRVPLEKLGQGEGWSLWKLKE